MHPFLPPSLHRFVRSTLCRWVAIATLTAFLAVACGLSSEPQKFTKATGVVNGADVFVVATEPAFPPFEFLTPTGELQGFDIDLMNTLTERLGLQPQYVKIPFDGLIAMLQASTADAAISAMTITPERMESIAFSRPYFKSGLAIAVREDTQGITSLADLKGQRIAVKLGTTGADMAAQVPNAELVTFDSTEMSLQELANGNVTAVINDAPATLGLLATGQVKGIKLAGPLLTEEYYGIGLPPASPNKPFVDQAITDLIADGTYAKLYRKWFAADPPALPDTFPQTNP